jgi:hypothetical protein
VGRRQHEGGGTRHTSCLRMLAVLPAAGFVAASFAAPAQAEEQSAPPLMPQTVHINRFVTVIVDDAAGDVSADAVLAPADAAAVEPNVDAVSAENAESPANPLSPPPVAAEPAEPSVADQEPQAELARGTDDGRRSVEMRNWTPSIPVSPEQYHASPAQYQSGMDLSPRRAAIRRPTRVWKAVRPRQRKVILARPTAVVAVSNATANCAEDSADSSSICVADPGWKVNWNCRWIPECSLENGADDELPAPVQPEQENELELPECDGENGPSTRYQPPPGQYQPPFPGDMQDADSDDACDQDSNPEPVAVDEDPQHGVVPGRAVASPRPPSAGRDVPRLAELNAGASPPEGKHGAAGAHPVAPPPQTGPPVEEEPLPIPAEPERDGHHPAPTVVERVVTLASIRTPAVSKPRSGPARLKPPRPRPDAAAPRRPEIDAQLTVLASRQASSTAQEPELDVLRLVAAGLALSILALLVSAAGASVARSGAMLQFGSLLRSSGLARGARTRRPRGISYRDP